MTEGIYKVNVSSLAVRKEPKIASNVYLERGTIVELTGQQKQFKKEYWVEVHTISSPIVKGFVQLKYLSKLR